MARPLRDIGTSVLDYLPNLAYVVVILILGFYALKAVKYLFTSIEQGTVVIGRFLPEWANPTYRLVRTLLLLFLLMVTYPYLPGSKSQFFQGFSVFLGALITFGSSSTIGNIVAGTVLTYTRAFRIGDLITIGDRTGVVIEKNVVEPDNLQIVGAGKSDRRGSGIGRERFRGLIFSVQNKAQHIKCVGGITMS